MQARKVALLTVLGMILMPAIGSAIQARKQNSRPKSKSRRLGAATAPKSVETKFGPMVGTWFLLDDQGQFVRSMKIIFSNRGEFKFVGSGWSSNGTFRFEDGKAHLDWKAVDDAPVQAGSMKKVLAVDMPAKRLKLDRFNYGKA